MFFDSLAGTRGGAVPAPFLGSALILQTRAALPAYLRSAPPQGTTRRLFRTARSQRPMSPAWLSECLGLAMARAGLGAPGKRAHLLRRTFATHLVQQGASLKAAADLLGHAGLSTTQVYAKILSLAVYLGHRNIRHTYWYLSAMPELLALGSVRWANALAPQKGAAHVGRRPRPWR